LTPTFGGAIFHEALDGFESGSQEDAGFTEEEEKESIEHEGEEVSHEKQKDYGFSPTTGRPNLPLTRVSDQFPY
jgi:hypothetical protein